MKRVFFRCSVGHTGVGDKNIPEFTGDNDGSVLGSLGCAEESLEFYYRPNNGRARLAL